MWGPVVPLELQAQEGMVVEEEQTEACLGICFWHVSFICCR